MKQACDRFRRFVVGKEDDTPCGAGSADRRMWDVLIVLVLSAAAGFGCYAAAASLDDALHEQDTQSVWFEAQPYRTHVYMTDRWSKHNARLSVHPLFMLATYPPVRLLTAGLGVDPISAVRILMAVVASISMACLYGLLRLLSLRRLDASIFCVLTALTSSVLFWYTVPETYAFAGMSILIALCFIAAAGRREFFWPWYVLMNIVTLAFTVTNWMVGIVATFVRLPWRRSVNVVVYAFAITAFLFGVQKYFVPQAEFFMGGRGERMFVLTTESGGTGSVATAFAFHAIVMPAIEETDIPGNPHYPKMSVQYSPIGAATPWGTAAAVVWPILLAAGVLGLLCARGHGKFRSVLAIVIAGQLLLHVLYGWETFQYSAHFGPLLVILAAWGCLTRARPVVLVLAAALAVALGVNNITQFRRASAHYEYHRELIEAGKMRIVDVPALKHVTVDGVEKDWSDGGFSVGALSVLNGRAEAAPKTAARVRVGWDARGLLVLVDVQDNHVAVAEADAPIATGDSVELYVSSGPGQPDVYRLTVAPTAAGQATRTDLHAPGRYETGGTALAAAAATRRTDRGYIVEARLPWSNLGIAPTIGQLGGLQVIVSDVDDAGRRVVMGWQPQGSPFDARHQYHLINCIRLTDRPAEPQLLAARGTYVSATGYRVDIRGPREMADRPVVIKTGRRVLAEGRLSLLGQRAVGTLAVELAPFRRTRPPLGIWVDGQRRALLAFPEVQYPNRFDVKTVRTFEGKYWLYLPKGYEDRSRRWPVILFLHGSGANGKDLELVKKYGLPEVMEKRQDIPFIVVSPQCPERDDWSSPRMISYLNSLLDEICATHRVDEERLYVTGLSMGGAGTWDLAMKYPDRFAAIAPICGRGDPQRAATIKHIPTWIFHGAKDQHLPARLSREMADVLTRLGADVTLTVYPDRGHDSWTPTYANPKLYTWFLSHRKRTRPGN